MKKITYNIKRHDPEYHVLSYLGQNLKDKIMKIGLEIMKNSVDDGWKGGRMSTSYSYKFNRIKWYYWQADCEVMYSLDVDGMKVASVYDNYHTGHVEFINMKTINKLYNMIGIK